MTHSLTDNQGRLWYVLSPDDDILTSAFLKSATITLEQLASSERVVLVSSALVFPQLSPDEQANWLILAGQYRKAQEAFKTQGSTLASLVHHQLLGGPYLVHGLAASWRVTYPDCKIYPSLLPQQYEKIAHHTYPHPHTAADAIKTGLIHTVISQSSISTNLASL